MADGVIDDYPGFEELLRHCLVGAMSTDSAAKMQLLVSFKASFGEDDIELFGAALFEKLACKKVSLMSEHELLSASIGRLGGSFSASGIFLDIGARETRVVPVYEGS